MIEVLAPGMQSTIQDTIRRNGIAYGISMGGTADIMAATLGNIILGQSETLPVLEIVRSPVKFRLHQNTTLALTGFGMKWTLDDKISIDSWKQITLKKGSILTGKPIQGGFRSYLCVSGGFQAILFDGTHGTDLRLELGGSIRALQKGDFLKINAPDTNVKELSDSIENPTLKTPSIQKHLDSNDPDQYQTENLNHDHKSANNLSLNKSSPQLPTSVQLENKYSIKDVTNSQLSENTGDKKSYRNQFYEDQDDSYNNEPLSSKNSNSSNSSESNFSEYFRDNISKSPSWRISHELTSYTAQRTIRILPGPELSWFNHSEVQRFVKSSWKIDSKSDRMGIRLKDGFLPSMPSKEMLSTVVLPGTVQITASGPIILFVDAQTTGGYPRIGQVCTVDLPVLAQKTPDEEISFEWISTEQALRLQESEQAKLAQIKSAISLH